MSGFYTPGSSPITKSSSTAEKVVNFFNKIKSIYDTRAQLEEGNLGEFGNYQGYIVNITGNLKCTFWNPSSGEFALLQVYKKHYSKFETGVQLGYRPDFSESVRYSSEELAEDQARFMIEVFSDFLKHKQWISPIWPPKDSDTYYKVIVPVSTFGDCVVNNDAGQYEVRSNCEPAHISSKEVAFILAKEFMGQVIEVNEKVTGGWVFKDMDGSIHERVD